MDSYEWDEAKYAANLLKHRIGFELVYQFDWSKAVFQPDLRYDYGEDRLVAYGRIDGQGHAIVYVRRGDRVRIISIRRAHDKEMDHYSL
jgi:uncharacterized protein